MVEGVLTSFVISGGYDEDETVYRDTVAEVEGCTLVTAGFEEC